jgi:hypothetical protein
MLSARVRPDRRAALLEAIEKRRFGEGFPYGDLGEVLCAGRVDAAGAVRWVEVCYCREFSGVALEAEIGYFEEFLTDITIADARNPESCDGYPACNDCDCTKKIRFPGEPFLEYLRRIAGQEGRDQASDDGRATQWLGWRDRVTTEEAARNLG